VLSGKTRMKSNNPRRSQKSSKPNENASDRVFLVSTLVAVFTASLVAFLPALRNQFVNWDDYETLVNNPLYRGLGWPQLRWMFTTFYMGHFQPLSWLSYALDYLVWGINPVGYHLTNIALHAANALLYFILARLLISLAFNGSSSGSQLSVSLGAALAALLFSLHPLRVESVAWATERRDVLSGFFYLLALYSYLAAQIGTQDRLRRRRLGASVLLYAFSLLSKGTAMTLPAVILLLDVYPLRRLPGNPGDWVKPQYRPILWEKLPFVALAGVFAFIAIFAQQHSGALRPVQQYFVSYRLGQAFYAICFYLWKSLVPINLSPLYELPFDFDAWMPLFLICAAGSVAFTIVLYLLRNRWPALFAAWVYYIVVLAPLAGMAQSGPQLVADRYTYLSCLSWPLLVGGGFARLWDSDGSSPRQPWAIALSATAILVTIALGAMSWQQSKVWRDTHTLWQRVIAVGPASSVAYYNLARGYEDEGKLDSSLAHYRRAVEINPANADAQYNLARLLAKHGMETEAVTHYRQALSIRPQDPEAHNNLGLLLARRGETDAAMKEFRKAVEIDPSYGKALFNMARVLAAIGELEKSIYNYRQALRLHPDEVEILLGLADALARQGQTDEAVMHLERAVALKPQSADAHTVLARMLAAQGRKSEAEKHYEQALQLLQSQTASPPSKR
jgi:protein O-mannosyl-transferase